MTTTQARLIESHEIAPEVRHFVFEAVGIERLVYQPGQFVSFTAPIKTGDGETMEITRAYSLASAASDGNRFELCLNRVEGGHLSPHLFAMQPGDAIVMREPLGGFVLRAPVGDSVAESVFVATGTGVAPFRAMLQANLREGSPAFTLLFGVRYESHLLYRSEFEEMARLFPQFTFLPTITRPGPDWTGRTGRVQKHLEEAIGKHVPGGELPVNFYLCGMKEMVDEIRSILKGIGFNRKQIRAEKYD